ncbi:MAG: CTP-dependent riboflavin kinase [Candidatus Thalassarchaeaceae archaeon]|nr:CTP-dependent riboflavin kinase [Candidatus Thalassarchaeaceae archaeon]|tara:strand:+ start:4058 stop:4501 length:444 start_codon:yes stop_codon:yes gene_type:complete
MLLHGAVSSGLGRAHIFMAQPHYQEQFKEVLGSSAWPGTLNVDLESESLDPYRKLRVASGLEEGIEVVGLKPIRIMGFEREGKSFGGATAFLASISVDSITWDRCALLIPDLTRHTKTAEIISNKFLREGLPCNDGDEVWVRIDRFL